MNKPFFLVSFLLLAIAANYAHADKIKLRSVNGSFDATVEVVGVVGTKTIIKEANGDTGPIPLAELDKDSLIRITAELGRQMKASPKGIASKYAHADKIKLRSVDSFFDATVEVVGVVGTKIIIKEANGDTGPIPLAELDKDSLIRIISVLGERIPSSSAAIKALCQKLEDKYSIRLFFDKVPGLYWNEVPKSEAKVEVQLATEQDYEKLYRYIQVFDQEFQKYPRTFIKKTNLGAVVFSNSVTVSSKGKSWRTHVPDYYKEILVLDFRLGEHAPTYVRHGIHHEFFHMIDEEFKHGVPTVKNKKHFWRDEKWEKLNRAGFAYGDGGVSVRHLTNQFQFVHPEKGFLNRYSVTAIEEDKAEIYATMFIKEEFDKARRWSQKDKVLESKIEFMKRFLERIDANFNMRYWSRLH